MLLTAWGKGIITHGTNGRRLKENLAKDAIMEIDVLIYVMIVEELMMASKYRYAGMRL